MSTEFLDKTGLTYFWGKLKAYFQPKLVSGTNIKTINNNSILGSGNIDLSSGGSFIVGEIKAVASNTVPSGWLECDGSEVAVADYADLYDVIGDLWGTSSDSDHFVLPNLMGRVPVGAGLGTASDATSRIVGQMGGSERVTLDVTQIPSHYHQIKYENYNRGSGSNATMGWIRYNQGAQTGTSEPTGGGQSHENMQPYAVVKYIIYAG